MSSTISNPLSPRSVSREITSSTPAHISPGIRKKHPRLPNTVLPFRRTVASALPENSNQLAAACTRIAPLFTDLPEIASGQLAAAARNRLMLRGEILFKEGDPVDSVLMIAAGRVKITQSTRQGREVILRVESAGEVVDVVGFSSGATHLVGAQVIESGSLLSWDGKTFREFMRRYPEISRNGLRILHERLCALQERFRDVATERIPQRLAKLLLGLIDKRKEPGGPLSVVFSQEELAQMTGTTLFTVSRILCTWAERGIIEPERKAIIIENLPGLVAVAAQNE